MKQLHTSWLRAAALFTTTHQQLEDELQRLRAKPNVPQEIIDKKDAQIEMLVSFYNQTDELVQAYRHALAQGRMENHFLTEMLAHKLSLPELMAYKPSKIIQVINQQTGESQTISDLNG